MSKQVHISRLSLFVRNPLRKIRVVPRYIPRRSLGIMKPLIQIQRCPMPGPSLTRGRILMIILRATSILLAPQIWCRLFGVRAQGMKWTWMFQLKSGGLIPPLINHNGTCLLLYLSCSSKRPPASTGTAPAGGVPAETAHHLCTPYRI